jgi:hypothetical protein
MFDAFPNVIFLKKVSREYTHFPWFNLIFLTALAIGLLIGWFKLRKGLRRVRAKFGGSAGQKEDENLPKPD